MEDQINVPLITATEAKKMVDSGAIIVDVRTPKEQELGVVPSALRINSEEILDRVSEFGSNKDANIVLYCKSGGRSGAVGEYLKSLGYKNVYNAGGYKDIKDIF